MAAPTPQRERQLRLRSGRGSPRPSGSLLARPPNADRGETVTAEAERPLQDVRLGACRTQAESTCRLRRLGKRTNARRFGIGILMSPVALAARPRQARAQNPRFSIDRAVWRNASRIWDCSGNSAESNHRPRDAHCLLTITAVDKHLVGTRSSSVSSSCLSSRTATRSTISNRTRTTRSPGKTHRQRRQQNCRRTCVVGHGNYDF